MLDAIRPVLRGALRSPFSEGSDLWFSPASLFAASEPGVWYDPSDFSTMFQDSAGTTPVTAVGQPVGRILDKSGRGNHATQTTSTSRPLLQQDGNGKYYLSFDGVDDWLVTPTITPGVDKAQVFAGVRKLSDAAVGILAELSSNYNAFAGSLWVAAPELTSVSGDYASASRGSAAPSTLHSAKSATTLAPITNVLTCTHDIAGDLSAIRLNRAASGTNGTADKGTGNYLAYPLYIGRRGGTTLPFNGHLYGLIVRFGANLPAETIASTETWINQRTGAY